MLTTGVVVQRWTRSDSSSPAFYLTTRDRQPASEQGLIVDRAAAVEAMTQRGGFTRNGAEEVLEVAESYASAFGAHPADFT